MLRMDAALATLVHMAIGRLFQRRLRKRFGDQRIPLGLQALRLRCHTGRAKRLVGGFADEHFAGVGPQVVERLLHAGLAFRRSIAEADHQIAAAFEVVGHFLRRLLGDLGDTRV